ncbi:glutamine amidotransferase [Botrimarina sp.]|uniref:glutamine amidotransferase n=1 Tax=Botrimarina sp. TaxID=2795802 RepID=UPI0032EDDAD4
MLELTTDPVGGRWLAAIAAALLLAAPWVFPPRAAGLSPQRRRAIQALRTAATLAFLVAWLRPTLVRVEVQTLRPTTLMLLDASRSMTVEDALDGVSRWEATRRLLAASEPALAKLADQQDVRAYLFDRGLTPLRLDGGRLALPGEPTGDETALTDSLAAALDSSRGGGADALAGVILISDGAQRARPPRDQAPLTLAPRLAAEGAPLYAAPVGERAAGDRADVAIDDLVVSDAAFAGAPLGVGATLRVAGFPNRTVRVRLLWEDDRGELQAVDAEQVTVRQGVDQYPIALRHAPPAAGEWKVSVVADTLDGETIADNNDASTFVTVREGGVRVLYLAGTNRPGGAAAGREQRFLRESLAESPDIVVERVLINYRPLGRDLETRFRPGAVDVVFVDNVDAAGLSRGTWRAIEQMVEQGAGLAMIGGRQSFGPGGHRATLGDVLPVTPGRAERQPLDAPVRDDVHLAGPLRMVPAPGLGGRHPIVRVPSEAGDPWAELPPLLGANRLGDDLKPGAQVIAIADGSAAPLMVLGQAGLGRALAFAGDSTWQWPLSGYKELHLRLWRQAVLWLAKKDDDPTNPVYVDLASRRVPAGARLDLAAGVRLDAAEADSGAIRYEGSVTLPDGSSTELPLPGAGVRTTGVFVDTAAAGDYRVKVAARRGEEPFGEAEARFNVPKRDLELERPAAEPDTLERLAQATQRHGGRTLALEELPTLLAELASKAPEQRREVVSRTTLYDKWPLLLVFAALMSVEWVVRRRAGMP